MLGHHAASNHNASNPTSGIYKTDNIQSTPSPDEDFWNIMVTHTNWLSIRVFLHLVLATSNITNEYFGILVTKQVHMQMLRFLLSDWLTLLEKFVRWQHQGASHCKGLVIRGVGHQKWDNLEGFFYFCPWELEWVMYFFSNRVEVGHTKIVFHLSDFASSPPPPPYFVTSPLDVDFFFCNERKEKRKIL